MLATKVITALIADLAVMHVGQKTCSQGAADAQANPEHDQHAHGQYGKHDHQTAGGQFKHKPVLVMNHRPPPQRCEHKQDSTKNSGCQNQIPNGHFKVFWM